MLGCALQWPGPSCSFSNIYYLVVILYNSLCLKSFHLSFPSNSAILVAVMMIMKASLQLPSLAIAENLAPLHCLWSRRLRVMRAWGGGRKVGAGDGGDGRTPSSFRGQIPIGSLTNFFYSVEILMLLCLLKEEGGAKECRAER